MRARCFFAGLCLNASLVTVLGLIRSSASLEVGVKISKTVVLAHIPRLPQQKLRGVRLRLKPTPELASRRVPVPVFEAPTTLPAAQSPAIPVIQPPSLDLPVLIEKPASRPVHTGSFQTATRELSTVKPATPQFSQASAFSGPAFQARSGSRQVVSGGFDTHAISGAVTRPQAITGKSVFDAQPIAAAKQAPLSAGAEPAFRSVQILSKPRPDYTEEARRKRIEGEVWLEVLFGADGLADIRRVARSLGHGLDESAMEAVRKIRFRPAQNTRGAVDEIATIRIQFQLAE